MLISVQNEGDGQFLTNRPFAQLLPPLLIVTGKTTLENSVAGVTSISFVFLYNRSALIVFAVSVLLPTRTEL
jgi:hypothetical protein